MSLHRGFRIARAGKVFNSDDDLPEGGRGGSIAVEQKRPRGRPRTGVHPMRGLRMPPELEAAIDAWIERQPDPKPSRAEAIRRLIEKGLQS